MASDIEDVYEEPDFSEFADWHVDNWQGSQQSNELSDPQKTIVQRNIDRLFEPANWAERVRIFEEALSEIKDETASKKKRAEFTIHFDHADFSDHPLNLEEYCFPCNLSFKWAKFGDNNVSFEGARFGDGDVWFDDATFGAGHITFRAATFGNGNVSFDRVNFGVGYVRFNRSTFGDGLVTFKNAKFYDGTVSFNKATFGDGDVLFVETTFKCRNVCFNKVTFGCGDVWFDKLKLGTPKMSFIDVEIKDNLFIRDNTYENKVTFQRLSVGGTADFSGSTFHEVPDFTDAKFGRPPDVSGMEVLAFKKLKIWKLWICPLWKAKTDERVKFRKLKAMALAANDHEKDGEFFAYEMLAKRGYDAANKGCFERILNWFYFILSNFGQSYKIPLSFLTLSLLGGWGGYGWWICESLAKTDRWLFAFEYSFRNFLPLLGSLFRFAPYPDDHESWFDKTFHQLAHSGFNVDWLTYVGIAQSFLGAVLLFLLLLGLRNKFRLK